MFGKRSQKRSPSSRNKTRKHLSFQELEGRQLMAGVSFKHGTIFIDGSNKADAAAVDYSGSNIKVTLNGKTATYKQSAVSGIEFHGGDKNDTFRNNTNVSCKAYGDGGHDTLWGGGGNDYLSGGDGDDVIHGRGGNDTLRGNKHNDWLYGEGGVDFLQGDSDGDHLYGGTEADTLYGGGGYDELHGGEHNDRLYGEEGDDKLWGDSGDDFLDGGSRNDHLYGGDGDDRLEGGTENDILEGGRNNDTLYGGNDNDKLYGGDGNDGLYGGSGADMLYGGKHADRILVMSGSSEHKDLAGEDALIVFANGAKTWNASEIEMIDQGLKLLHLRTTRNDNLLETAGNGVITFTRGGNQGSVLGTNFGNGRVTVYDAGLQSQHVATLNTIHEIAHNWDNEHAGWNTWLALSGWRSTRPSDAFPIYEKSQDGKWWHSKSAAFGREYGKNNPHDDLATAWESYFRDRAGMSNDASYPTNTLPSIKYFHIDRFFSSLT